MAAGMTLIEHATVLQWVVCQLQLCRASRPGGVALHNVHAVAPSLKPPAYCLAPPACCLHCSALT